MIGIGLMYDFFIVIGGEMRFLILAALTVELNINSRVRSERGLSTLILIGP